MKKLIRYAKDYNNAIEKIVDEHKERFAAFAVLPMTSPNEAADELERAVKELGFVGTMINGTTTR